MKMIHPFIYLLHTRAHLKFPSALIYLPTTQINQTTDTFSNYQSNFKSDR